LKKGRPRINDKRSRYTKGFCEGRKTRKENSKRNAGV